MGCPQGWQEHVVEKEQSFHHTVLGELAILVQKKDAGGLLYTTDPD